MKGQRLFALVALPFLTPQQLFSSPTSTERAYDSGPIVVTGTKTEKSFSDSPVKTDVITAEDIQNYHFQSLDQAISTIPGVSVQDNVGTDGKNAVIQGLSGSKVMLLVDGIPLIQTSNSGSDLTQIPIWNVAQIEVVKGASSSLYGSQAMGGVINIITKKLHHKPNLKFNFKNSVALNNKSNQHKEVPSHINTSFSSPLALGVKQEIAYSKKTNDQVELDPSTVTKDGASHGEQEAKIKLSKHSSQNTNATLQYNYKVKKNKSTGSSPIGTSGQVEEVHTSNKLRNQSFFLFASKEVTRRVNIKSHLTYQRVDDLNIQLDKPSTPYPETIRSSKHQLYRGELQLDIYPGEEHILTAGLTASSLQLDQNKTTYQSLFSSTNQNEIGAKKQESFESYIQDNIILENKEFVLGIRGQYDDDFGYHFSPKISVLYSPNLIQKTKTQIRSSISQGYRVPTLKEKYYFLDHSSFGYTIEGNQNLQPETSLSYQIGPEIIHSKWGHLSLNLFINKIKNLILPESSGQNSSLDRYTYLNVGESESKGFELDYKYKITDKSYLKGSFTYTESIDKRTNLFIPSRPLYKAQSSLALGLSKKIQWINTINYEGNDYSNANNTAIRPGFYQINSIANYQYRNDIFIRLGIDNITNIKRSPLNDSGQNTPDKRPLIGRLLYIGLNFTKG